MKSRKLRLLKRLVHVVFYITKCFQKENRYMNSLKMIKKNLNHMLIKQKNNINLNLSS